MKFLKEDNDNDYARRILEVEILMRDNEVSISYMGGNTIWIKIKDKEFEMRHPEFPRITDEERLIFIES